MESITSRVSALEDGLKQVGVRNSRLDKFFTIIGNAGETHSLANLLSGISNTPDPREGEGAGL